MAEVQLKENQGKAEVQMGVRAVLEPGYNITGILFSIFPLILCLYMGYMTCSSPQERTFSLMLNKKSLEKDSEWSS